MSSLGHQHLNERCNRAFCWLKLDCHGAKNMSHVARRIIEERETDYVVAITACILENVSWNLEPVTHFIFLPKSDS